MKVVEIGCGNQPGPYFEGAAEHYIVDTDVAALEMGLRPNTSFTPVVASAADMGFDDASIDTVLARNVFGDPSLILASFEKIMHLGAFAALAKEEKYEKLIEHMLTVEDRTGLLKADIMKEAGRILLPGGKLVVVEQFTPKVARRFFEKAADYSDEFDPGEVFDIEHNVPLGEVTPANYARVHGDLPGLETWVATKK